MATAAGAASGAGVVTVSAFATGGQGGLASLDPLAQSAGGAGGAATATATGSSSGGKVVSTASATGGAGGDGTASSASGGQADATSKATSTGAASVIATSIATGGNGGATDMGPGATGQANAESESNNGGGTVQATAHSPGGGPASAMVVAAIEPGAPPPVEISKGQSASVGFLTPGKAMGEMSAGYGGEGETLVYETTADFSFTTSQSEPLYLTLLNFAATGDGFDSLELKVTADASPFDYTFSSLRGAEMFFLDNKIDLGFEGAGPQVVDISLFLTASHVGDGFGFSYNVAVPEAPTWGMMLAGFAGLGLATVVRGRRMVRVTQLFAPPSA
jgi:hypothetical protein